MNRFGIAVTIGVLVLVSAAVFASPPGQRSGRHPKTAKIRGHVTPSRQVELMAPLAEILEHIDVERGQRVNRGQTLARLDDKLQSVVVEAARLKAKSQAEIRRTSLDVEEAMENLQRITNASMRDAATATELTRARIAVGRAEAAHEQALETHAVAQASLKLEERRLIRHRIMAPFDGTVVHIEAEIGAMLTDEDPILTLADLDTLEAHVNVPAEHYGELTVGSVYAITAGAPINADLEATLKTVDPIIDTASQTFACVFTIDNRDRMPAGFTVYLNWPQTPDPPAPALVTEPRRGHRGN